MTSERLSECLAIIRWTPDTLARVLECDLLLVEAWMDGEIEIPPKAAAWIEVLAQTHMVAETGKPKGLKGKRFRG